MYETGKKIALILGHLVCIFIIIYCMADSQAFAKEEEEKEVYTVVKPFSNFKQQSNHYDESSPTKVPQKEAEVIPLTNTPVPTPSEFPIITEPPMITETPVVTEPPLETVIPSATDVPTETPTSEPSIEAADERSTTKLKVMSNISEGSYSDLENNRGSWWFRRKSNHVPSDSGEIFDISEFQGYFLNKDAEDKVIYLTLDCGYSSDNTDVILDILKKHEVKVTYFITKDFLDDSHEEVRRMVTEGHAVGNHSVTHPDLTTLTDEEIYLEITGCEEAFNEVTGTQMDLFFRPPTGAYSKRTMQLTEELGYKTIFWSIAYKDYDQNNQPGKEYVIDHFKEYHHNGAIVLMHNDSVSNMEAMDEVLTFLKEQGYRFGTLDELGM